MCLGGGGKEDTEAEVDGQHQVCLDGEGIIRRRGVGSRPIRNMAPTQMSEEMMIMYLFTLILKSTFRYLSKGGM